MYKKEITVIVVDDSALIRALLQEVLDADSRITVVATAKDAYEARELIKRHNPDVITLDIEMPKMNGITFLENLMRLRPMPVVMISTLTQDGAPATLRALELGAVDFIAKPKSDNASDLGLYGELICEKVYEAANANVKGIQEQRSNDQIQAEVSDAKSFVKNKKLDTRFICAIGASTGGTEAIKDVITVLPENSPPIVIAQHIPETFSKSFAQRVDNLSKMQVYEAEDNQPILTGCVYIAPGHSHLKVAKGVAGGYVCRLDNGPAINRHRPAVEVLFDSVRELAGPYCMGILLTGMGADGAEALLRMKQENIYTIAQDEESCVVWGMPGAAVKMGAATKVYPLKDIPRKIISKAYS